MHSITASGSSLSSGSSLTLATRADLLTPLSSLPHAVALMPLARSIATSVGVSILRSIVLPFFLMNSDDLDQTDESGLGQQWRSSATTPDANAGINSQPRSLTLLCDLIIVNSDIGHLVDTNRHAEKGMRTGRDVYKWVPKRTRGVGPTPRDRHAAQPAVRECG